jgi:hypothetical protein
VGGLYLFFDFLTAYIIFEADNSEGDRAVGNERGFRDVIK